MIKIVVSSAIISLWLSFFAVANTVTDVDSLPWTVGNETILEQAKPAEISSFLNKHLPEDWDNIDSGIVGSYKWFDVNGDKNLEFFVTLDSSTRHFFNELLIFASVANKKIFIQSERVWMLENIDQSIKDLNNDEVFELLLPIELGYYRGAAPIPIWTSIFRWDHGKFRVSDSEFRNYYALMLPKLELQIEKIKQEEWLPQFDTDVEDDEYLKTMRLSYEQHLAIPTIIRDKILRLLGKYPKAGYKLALEWAKNSDREMRENAIIVFQDLYDQESQEQLRLLMKDSDPIIALQARFAIQSHEGFSKK